MFSKLKITSIFVLQQPNNWSVYEYTTITGIDGYAFEIIYHFCSVQYYDEV